MAKGLERRFEGLEFLDPVTGTRVRRLTPPDSACIRNYFYQKCFSENGRFLVLGCETGDEMNLWRLDLGTGLARQLTEGPGDNCQGAYLSPDDRFLFLTRGGRRHIRLDLETLEESVAYEAPPGWGCYGTWSPNSACTRAAGMLMLLADRVGGARGWEAFRRQYEARPLMRLVDVDLSSGSARIVHEERRYLGHPMFRPFDDDLMGFCHEGPHDLVDSRIWLIGRDGSALRRVVPERFADEGGDEACMHEFWLPDGSRLIFVGYSKGRQERSIWAADPESLALERLMGMPPCAHLMSDARGERLVGDGAGQLGDVADQAGHAFEADPNLYLFDLGSRSRRVICAHGSSWAEYRGNTQAAHPHPSFSPDGDRVLFSSDSSGLPAVYLADVGVTKLVDV